jgi:hypothetical protein
MRTTDMSFDSSFLNMRGDYISISSIYGGVFFIVCNVLDDTAHERENGLFYLSHFQYDCLHRMAQNGELGDA